MLRHCRRLALFSGFQPLDGAFHLFPFSIASCYALCNTYCNTILPPGEWPIRGDIRGHSASSPAPSQMHINAYFWRRAGTGVNVSKRGKGGRRSGGQPPGHNVGVSIRITTLCQCETTLHITSHYDTLLRITSIISAGNVSMCSVPVIWLYCYILHITSYNYHSSIVSVVQLPQEHPSMCRL